MIKLEKRFTTLAICVLLLALIIGVLFVEVPIAKAEVQDNAVVVSQIDYDDYTDNPLPQKIGAENILQVIPKELFNSGETYVYCGNEYGFVLHNEPGTITNYILIFEININVTSDDIATARLEIKYENAFNYGANGIFVASTDRRLMLGDVTFRETIVDYSYNNIFSTGYNPSTNHGAFFIQSRQGDSQKSYYDIDSLSELTISTGIDTFVSFLGFIPVAGDIIEGVANVGINAMEVAYTIATIWKHEFTTDTAVDYPLTVEDQLTSESTGYTLMKSVGMESAEKVIDFLSYSDQSDSKGGDYVEYITRINNLYNIGYYLMTEVDFGVYLNSTFGVNTNSIARYTAYGAYNEQNECTSFSSMSQDENGFAINDESMYVPLLKGTSFKFTTAEAGEYYIALPSDYNYAVRVADSETLLTPNERDNYFLSANATYEVHIYNEDAQVNWEIPSSANSYSCESEFLNNEVKYVLAQVKREQSLPFNEDGLASGMINSGISFVKSDDGENNDVFKITSSNLDQLSVYLADENLNILAEGNVGEDGIYINYPLSGEYYLICKNSGEQTDITIEDTGALILGEREYAFTTGDGLFYEVEIFNKQYYAVAGACYGVYSANATQQVEYNGVYHLSQGDYYLLSDNATQLSIYYDSASIVEISAPNTVYTFNDNNADAIFRLFCNYTIPVQLSAPCDVYCNEELIAKNVTQVLLEGGEVTNIYDFVVTDGSKSLSFVPAATSITYNNIVTANNAEGFTAYKFTLSETTRIFADSQQDIAYRIYNAALNKIEEDHGYLLEAGNYYIVVENSGNYSFEVKEKLIPINVSFIVDGAMMADPTGQVYYYGKSAILPVPEKYHYDFTGWQLPDGTMLTDAQGATLQPIYYDEVTLTAQWVVRKVELKVNMAEGSALWWSGSAFSETKVTVDFQTALFNDLANLYNTYVSLPEGNKPGHYFTQFTTTYISSEGNVDTYEFAPVWQVESYNIQFVLANGDMLSYYNIDYGTEISASLFAASVFNPTKRGYSFVNWQYEDDTYYDMAKGDRVPDFTPNVGVIDTIAVTLVAQFALEEYTITINGEQIKVTCQDSYKIKTLAEYGISASAYNGKNIYYIRSDNNATYYEGGVVKDVYSDIILSLKEQYATVNITYTDCDGANNPTSLSLGQPYTLQAATKNTYEFDHWEYNGNTITSLSVSSLVITGYLSNANPQFARTITAIWKSGYVAVGLGTHTLSYVSGNSSRLHVDCTTKAIPRTVTFRIASDVKEVTFHDNNRSWGGDFAIFVESRNTELIINFDGLTSVRGYANDSVINARLCPSLVINAMTDISFSAGEISSLTGNFDKAAIICNDLTLKGENINIYGGEYITNYLGNQKTIASRGISEYNRSTLTITAKSVNIYGGDGANGVSFGGQTASAGTEYSEKGSDGLNGNAGVNGACAIYWTGNIYVSKDSDVAAYGGNGGNGGDGGNGGKGGPGKDGSFGVTTKDPGDGGDGGNGGRGGNGALAIQGNPTISGEITTRNGNGGKGGTYGSGGVPGDPVETIWGNPRTGAYGEHGNNGQKGTDKANDGL